MFYQRPWISLEICQPSGRSHRHCSEKQLDHRSSYPCDRSPLESACVLRNQGNWWGKYTSTIDAKYNWKETIEKRFQPDSLLEIFEVLWLWIVPVVWIIRGVAHLQAQMKWNWEMNKKNFFPGGLFGCFSPPWSPPSQHRRLWMDSQYFLNYATSLWLERSNVICNIAENRVLTSPLSDSQMKSQQWATLLFT